MKTSGEKTCAVLPPSELDLVITCSHSKRCLLKAGVNTLSQLRTLSRDDLLRIRGIGPVIADGILDAQARYTSLSACKEP
jgi:DNA-directed RNA polymerase alpha subunit